eukprot:6903913-Pyramimonas_sp.AAC.1
MVEALNKLTSPTFEPAIMQRLLLHPDSASVRREARIDQEGNHLDRETDRSRDRSRRRRRCASLPVARG